MDRIGAKHVTHHMIVEKGEGQFGNLARPSRGRLRYCGRRRWLRKTENVQRIQEANSGGPFLSRTVLSVFISFPLLCADHGFRFSLETFL
jgi:hypothetical protein